MPDVCFPSNRRNSFKASGLPACLSGRPRRLGPVRSYRKIADLPWRAFCAALSVFPGGGAVVALHEPCGNLGLILRLAWLWLASFCERLRWNREGLLGQPLPGAPRSSCVLALPTRPLPATCGPGWHGGVLVVLDIIENERGKPRAGCARETISTHLLLPWQGQVCLGARWHHSPLEDGHG